MLNSTVALLVLIGCGLLIGWAPHDSAADTLAAVGLLLLLLRFAFVWVGVYLGLVFYSSPDAVTAVRTLEFPIGFLSSVFVATATMPIVLATLAEWNPLSSTVTAARELFGNPGAGGGSWIAQHSVLMAIIWPLLIIGVFFPLSVRRYRQLNH